MHQSHALKFLQYVAQLSLIGLQEFAACRYVKKKIAYQEITSRRTGNRLLPYQLGAFDIHARSQFASGLTGPQFHLGHGCNRSQSLSPEAHRAQSKQIVGFTYFGRGMAFERKTCIGLRHPLPVVHYLNRSLARIFHHHVNPCSRSVYGILHQFFYHRSRPLYHFTGGNLVCHRIRQQMYNIAHLSEYA